MEVAIPLQAKACKSFLATKMKPWAIKKIDEYLPKDELHTNMSIYKLSKVEEDYKSVKIHIIDIGRGKIVVPKAWVTNLI